jgi:hypothetical protein
MPTVEAMVMVGEVTIALLTEHGVTEVITDRIIGIIITGHTVTTVTIVIIHSIITILITIIMVVITIIYQHQHMTTTITTTTINRLSVLLRHIDNVRDSCLLLGQRLISRGEEEVGRKLIANGYKHDNSKFSGIEWLYLYEDVLESEPELFKAALFQHTHTNPHHPEFWPGGIDTMPREYKGEMVCDWHARSSEFGTDLRDWVKSKATKKFRMNNSGRTYKELKELLDLLLERKFI